MNNINNLAAADSSTNSIDLSTPDGIMGYAVSKGKPLTSNELDQYYNDCISDIANKIGGSQQNNNSNSSDSSSGTSQTSNSQNPIDLMGNTKGA